MIERRHREYRFGGFRFIPERQLLRHGDRAIPLGSRALDLLHLLVSRSGELIGKEELKSFAWPNTHLHESNLKVNISALRRALAQAAPDIAFIVTVPGRGYRFVAAVDIVDEPAGPAPVAIAAQSGELPQGPAIVGRGDAIAEIAARLIDTGFVTVVGPAGVGKTTVAIGAAHALADRFGDGVRFVDLATVGAAPHVATAVALAVGVDPDMIDMPAALVAALRASDMLLLFDNCEHVLSAVATIADQLRAAVPRVHILATSREPMRTRAETVYRLAPLACPDPGRPVDAAEAMAFPAVELFVRRAREAHGYALDDADAPVVAAICRRLDGIALAIELAVPRLSDSTPSALLALLEQGLEPLNQGSGGGIARHQTLLATLDWSYRLLSRAEARLLRLLSVFAGSFSIEDIFGIADRAGGPAEEVAAWTESLVAKSLLSATWGAGSARYRLLESTRCFAAEALRSGGETAQALARHAHYLLDVFERAEAEWPWRAREDWTAAYGPRANDLRKAIDWAFGEGGDRDLAVRLTVAAIPLWDELSTVGESRLRAGRALRTMDDIALRDPVLRMKLMISYASGLNFSDRLGPEADAAWDDGYRLAQDVGSVDYQLRGLWGHAVLQSFSGRHRQALATLDRFRALAEREHESSAIPDGDRLALMTGFYLGEIEPARQGLARLAREHVAMAAQSGIARFQVDRLVGIRVALAFALWMRGDHRRAMATVRLALDRAAELRHRVSQSNALAQVGIPLALHVGDLEGARRHADMLAEDLALRETAIWTPVSRFYQGAIAAADGDPGSVDAMRAAVDQLIANGFLVRVPIYLAMAGEAALKFGRLDAARDAIAAALDRCERQSEYWCRPEALRMHAMLAWREGDRAAAERTLAQAVEAAGKIGAASFELRSATSLAELLVESGRPVEAAIRLAPIHARFDAGFDSIDVRRAGELLATLKADGR